MCVDGLILLGASYSVGFVAPFKKGALGWETSQLSFYYDDTKTLQNVSPQFTFSASNPH